MQRPIRPDWLLRQANELAGRTANPGQPRNADLRRAVSSAYYALFHAITLSSVQQTCLSASDGQIYALVRLIRHEQIKRACQPLLGGSAPRHLASLVEEARTSERARRVAEAFPALQEARHQADYDHEADFTRPIALNYVDVADAATLAVQCDSNDDPGLVAFRTMIVVTSK